MLFRYAGPKERFVIFGLMIWFKGWSKWWVPMKGPRVGSIVGYQGWVSHFSPEAVVYQGLATGFVTKVGS